MEETVFPNKGLGLATGGVAKTGVEAESDLVVPIPLGPASLVEDVGAGGDEAAGGDDEAGTNRFVVAADDGDDAVGPVRDAIHP